MIGYWKLGTNLEAFFWREEGELSRVVVGGGGGEGEEEEEGLGELDRD